MKSPSRLCSAAVVVAAMLHASCGEDVKPPGATGEVPGSPVSRMRGEVQESGTDGGDPASGTWDWAAIR